MNQKEKFEKKFNKELIFLKNEGKLVDDWANVFNHCYTEGLVASILGELIRFKKEDQDLLITAAILHDWFKRNEREATNKYGAEEYNKKAKESSRFLKEAGYCNDVVLLTESVGHSSLNNILGKDLIYQVMHYIDDITFGNTVVSLDERIDELESAERYRELNESGRKFFNGKTYFQVQREVGHIIENEIAKRLKVNPEMIVSLIKHRLKKSFNI
ncbi:MAG: HD domain-containing protein [Candidatus Staskawiczbacteria bacterium]|nr:HD domain-containing protein [Candidatus Staskawiczbacteria bacterium]